MGARRLYEIGLLLAGARFWNLGGHSGVSLKADEFVEQTGWGFITGLVLLVACQERGTSASSTK
jgi:hypothetical protein